MFGSKCFVWIGGAGATVIFSLVEQFSMQEEQNLKRFERECQTGWLSRRTVWVHERTVEFLSGQ